MVSKAEARKEDGKTRKRKDATSGRGQGVVTKAEGWKDGRREEGSGAVVRGESGRDPLQVVKGRSLLHL